MKMKKLNKENKKNPAKVRKRGYLFYIIILSFIILMLPHMIRFIGGNNTLIGSQAYHHYRTAENLINGGYDRDTLIYGGRDFVFLPYHYALAGVGHITGMDIASKLLPFALGILSIIIFYLLLKSLGVGDFERFIISILLLISPPFLYLFTVSTPNCLSIFMILLGSYLFLRENRVIFGLSVLCFIIASFSGVFNSLIILIIIFFFYNLDNKNKMRAFIATIVLVGFYFVHPVRFYYNFEFPVTNLLKVISSDLGAKAGFSPFAIVLGVIGVFYSWKDKGRYYPLYMALLFITGATAYMGGETSFYNTFILTIFASVGLKRLNTLEWKFPPIRNLSFILIGCGLLFSTASYLNRMPFSMPDNSMAESMEWLNENSYPGQIVLSHYSRGHWIESIAQRPALIDGFSSSISNFDKKYNDTNEMFYSMDLDDSAEILRAYNISYIFIDEEMRQGLVWSKKSEGLLYLLRNNMTFRKVYSNANSEIWQTEVS